MFQQTLRIEVKGALRRGREILADFGTRLYLRAQEGQSLVEYAIIVALIAVVVMGAIQAMGVGIAGVFQRMLGSIQNIG